MHSTTLRGVFPEPKPVYRRNFIKENVKSIKQMQGMLQEAGVIQPKKRLSGQDKFRNVPRLIKSRESITSKSLGNLSKPEEDKRVTHSIESRTLSTTRNVKSKLTKLKLPRRGKQVSDSAKVNSGDEEESKLTHRAMQTEREEDLSRLYDTGVIKYPSPGIVKSPKRKSPQGGYGDEVDAIITGIDNLTTDENKDFIKENKNIKTRAPKLSLVKVMAQAPPTYQRGVVPKYLRDRKEDNSVEIDAECPPGHILLPEEERKETLRVLRQSYADRIQELNMMPVRNDTLKMKKRKMEIEEELKRIDGGIKVFQRPKVFVKINA